MLHYLLVVYRATMWDCSAGFVCGDCTDINACTAGEPDCLLINEGNRWPGVGGSSERTATRSGGQHNTNTWDLHKLDMWHS